MYTSSGYALYSNESGSSNILQTLAYLFGNTLYRQMGNLDPPPPPQQHPTYEGMRKMFQEPNPSPQIELGPDINTYMLKKIAKINMFGGGPGERGLVNP